MAQTIDEALRIIDRAQARQSLHAFVRQGWSVLEPATPFVDNWHLVDVCEHFECLARGQVRNLVVNVPPGCMKSLIASVFWPAWVWLQRPSWRALFACANPRVSLRDSTRRRDLITSRWYQETFTPSWRLADDQNAKSLFKNTETGSMLAISVGQTVVGDRADHLGIDDPLDPQDANSLSSNAIENVKVWHDQSWANRLADVQKGTRSIIMQRLHEEDLTGHVLRTEPKHWTHLCLPMEFDPERRCSTLGGLYRDPRITPGELLFPARFPATWLRQEKARLGSYGTAGQLQQLPAAAEGGMFKRRDWAWWSRSPGPAQKRPNGCSTVPSVGLPPRFDRMCVSVDATFKDTAKSDFVGIGVWGTSGPHRYLVWRSAERMGFTATLGAIRAAIRVPGALGFKGAPAVLIEDKANGPAILDVLRKEVSGLVPVEPDGSKEARAWAIQPVVEGGNVFLPEDDPEVGVYVDQFAAFPRGSHDDEVDQTTQAVRYLMESDGLARLKAWASR